DPENCGLDHRGSEVLQIVRLLTGDEPKRCPGLTIPNNHRRPARRDVEERLVRPKHRLLVGPPVMGFRYVVDQQSQSQWLTWFEILPRWPEQRSCGVNHEL